MKITIFICITAVLIAVIHDITGPLIVLGAQFELAHEIERIQRSANRPSLEIIPEPRFKANPELRKEKL